MNYYDLLRTIKTIQRYLDNGDKHERIDSDLKLDIESCLSHLVYCIVTSKEFDYIFNEESEDYNGNSKK